MTDVQHTVLDTNNGWGGTALGAGFGGLVGSWFGQGMNGNESVSLICSMFTCMENI